MEEIAVVGRTLRGTRDDYKKRTGRGARHGSTGTCTVDRKDWCGRMIPSKKWLFWMMLDRY